MQINADTSLPVAVRPGEAAWVASPATGVERLMLERDGGEVARATSIVRFRPGATFEAHSHDAGEEYFVLEGTFSDETGDHPAGTYVRNPPGSAHTPFTRDGATLFVKLRQFAPGDHAHLVVDTRHVPWLPTPTRGREILPLHEFDGMRTCLLRWATGTTGRIPEHPDGTEILVLEGSVTDLRRRFPEGSWLRRPSCGEPTLYAEAATLLLKTGHLRSRRDLGKAA